MRHPTLSEADTAELDRYRDWLDRIQTPDDTRPPWFSADRWLLPTVPTQPARHRHAARHRRPSRWARLASWWRVASQPVLWKENHAGPR